MENHPDSITLVSHPSRAWPKARDLYTAIDGTLLGIGHRALWTACERLKEEGWPGSTVVVVTDAHGERPDQAAKIANVLGIAIDATAALPPRRLANALAQAGE